MKYGQRKRFVKISAAPQEDTSEKKTFLGRVGQGLFGSGLALSNLRNAATYANPDEVLYHGTAPQNAAAILEGGGLDTRYAGFAKRLNSIMLANAGGKAVMDAGIEVDSKLLSDMTERATRLMGQQRKGGMEKFDSVSAVEQATREVLSERGMDSEAIEKMISGARPELKKAGKRIYMANTPRVAALYGQEGADELDIVRKIFDPSNPMDSAKFNLKTIGNFMTGGIVPKVRRTLDTRRYNRELNDASNVTGQSTEAARDLMKKLSLPQREGVYLNSQMVENELRRLDPNITQESIDKIVGLANKGQLGTSFGVSANRTNMKSLSDFPMLSKMMALQPALKYTASDLLPSLDPVRDLSVPESIPLSDFRSMDLIDTTSTTPLMRVGFNNPKRAVSLGERAIALRKASPFAALGLVGADVVQDAIRQKGTYTGKAFKALADRRNRGQQEKQAAFLRGSTKAGLREAAGVAKKIALPAAAIGGVGVGASKLYGAATNFVEKQLDSPQMREFKEKEKQRLIKQGKDPRVAEGLASKAARMMVLNVLAVPAGVAGGALAAGISHPRAIYRILKGKLPKSGDGLMSVPMTGFLGYLGTPQAMVRAEEIRTGKDFSDQTPLTLPFKGSKVDKFIRDNPEYAGLADLATYASIPLLGAYVGKKHYSGHYSRFMEKSKAGFEAASAAINASGGISPSETDEKLNSSLFFPGVRLYLDQG